MNSTHLFSSSMTMNGPISHKSQCIHSVVPQLETTLTSQPSQLPMYLPWDYIDPSTWLIANVHHQGNGLQRHELAKILCTSQRQSWLVNLIDHWCYQKSTPGTWTLRDMVLKDIPYKDHSMLHIGLPHKLWLVPKSPARGHQIEPWLSLTTDNN